MGYLLSYIIVFCSIASVGFCRSNVGLRRVSEGGGGGGGGGDDDTSCVTELLPCQNFLHTPKLAPPNCCLPLRNLVNNEAKCLCGVLSNVGLLQTFNFTEDDAVKLAEACGATPNLALCKNSSSPVGPPHQAPSQPSPSQPIPAPPSQNNGSSTSPPPTSAKKNGGSSVQFEKSSAFIAFFVVYIFLGFSHSK